VVANVLIVEDDTELAGAMATALHRRGFTVTTAATCKDGLQAVSNDRPAVMILDIRLPDGEGWQILEKLRDRGVLDSLHVLLTSSSRVSRSRLREWNVVRFLPKPFDISELVAAVSAAVDQSTP
jgi:DNA-binding response OmpR family regulator